MLGFIKNIGDLEPTDPRKKEMEKLRDVFLRKFPRTLSINKLNKSIITNSKSKSKNYKQTIKNNCLLKESRIQKKNFKDINIQNKIDSNNENINDDLKRNKFKKKSNKKLYSKNETNSDLNQSINTNIYKNKPF